MCSRKCDIIHNIHKFACFFHKMWSNSWFTLDERRYPGNHWKSNSQIEFNQLLGVNHEFVISKGLKISRESLKKQFAIKFKVGGVNDSEGANRNSCSSANVDDSDQNKSQNHKSRIKWNSISQIYHSIEIYVFLIIFVEWIVQMVFKDWVNFEAWSCFIDYNLKIILLVAIWGEFREIPILYFTTTSMKKPLILEGIIDPPHLNANILLSFGSRGVTRVEIFCEWATLSLVKLMHSHPIPQHHKHFKIYIKKIF